MERTTIPGMVARNGWLGFGLWAAAGAAASVVIAGAATIGLFVLPVALLLAALLATRLRVWPESLGVLAGIAGAVLAIGVANLGSNPCSDSGTVVLQVGEHQAGCGGMAAAPFLVAGFVLAISAAGAYWLARRRV
jgi:hypothetical protein